VKLAPSPAGAYLNSAATGGGGTAKQIILDTLDPGYPYTRLASGILTLEAAGPVTITGQAVYSGGASITAQLRLNGGTTPVATGNTAVTSSLTYSYTARAGDQLALWETDGLANFSITTGATNTFIHIAPAGWPQFTGLPTTLMRANMR
jgi:hypothetical protein